MDKDEKFKKRVSYIKAAVFWLMVFVAAMIIEDPFAETEAKEIVEALCNAFTVPGIIFVGWAGLTYVAYRGGYDGISYAFSNFGLHNIFTQRQPKQYKDFYEYKQMKDKRGRKWMPQYLLIGGISLAVAVILLVVYSLL